jgi:hypothetical protein
LSVHEYRVLSVLEKSRCLAAGGEMALAFLAKHCGYGFAAIALERIVMGAMPGGIFASGFSPDDGHP